MGVEKPENKLCMEHSGWWNYLGVDIEDTEGPIKEVKIFYIASTKYFFVTKLLALTRELITDLPVCS